MNREAFISPRRREKALAACHFHSHKISEKRSIPDKFIRDQGRIERSKLHIKKQNEQIEAGGGGGRALNSFCAPRGFSFRCETNQRLPMKLF